MIFRLSERSSTRLLASNRHSLARITCLFIACISIAVSCSAASAQSPPHFKVDPYWPKELPNRWIVGQISGISVDRDNHIWVLQRPGSNTSDEISADPSSPRHAMCCVPAPPVLVFDTAGNLLKSWGGPGKGYDWPASEHSIYVDQQGNVWITGNGEHDGQVLKFTGDGKFLKQFGHPFTGPAHSLDKTMLGSPAGIKVDEAAHEVYIGDGYLNKRIVVLDSDTLVFKRMWGGYGNVPSDADPGPYNPKGTPDKQFRSPVHSVNISNDGLVYVCDRVNDRVQIFTKQGKFLKEFFLRTETQAPGTMGQIIFSLDPGQKYMLVADPTNNVVWTLQRSDGKVIGTMGHDGRNAGQFHALHSIGLDSAGNLYTGEVESGKRLQKFIVVK
jgi:DNA-binding beta-propeller fold protein YncE